MDFGDFISLISLSISIIVAVWTFINERNTQKKEKEFAHRSLVFDDILLQKVPELLSKFLEDTSNIEICDNLSSLFVNVKKMSVIYYIGNKMDDYYKLRNLIILIDENLINISSCDNTSDKVDISDQIIKNIKDVYEIIYKDGIA